ncbi:MAG: hypothetical protein DHS20C02_02110 [Micavibrio sp.]|nr:MAG: hypothetical protein DHS20C02_02110 [Micavibrio sp.]
MTEFQKFMKDPEEEYRMIVFGDAVRRAAVWQRKGIKNRTICEGLLKAALESIAEEEDFREWRWFWLHTIQEAQNHLNKLESIFIKDEDSNNA